MAAFTVLGVGGLLALPLFALPVILAGAYADRAWSTRPSSGRWGSCCSRRSGPSS
jgi:hypothetical protein